MYLKSRKGLMNYTTVTTSWMPNELLLSGHNEARVVWRTLNRFGTGIGRTKEINLKNWGSLDS